MSNTLNLMEIENKLSLIWKEVLKEDIDDRFTSFFDLGGSSFKLMKLFSAINNEFKKNISINALITYNTIASQSFLILNSGNKSSLFVDNDQIVFFNEFSEYKQNLFLIHDGTGEVGGYSHFCYNLRDTFNIIGISANWKTYLAPRLVNIEEIAIEYIRYLKIIQEYGVYFIGGWSAGGVIAFEMANILERDDDNVRLFLFDAPHPNFIDQSLTFSFQGEFKLLNEIYGITFSKSTIDSNDISLLWNEFLNYINDIDSYDSIANILDGYIKVIPDIRDFNNHDKICKVNYMRSIISSLKDFNPEDKILSDIIYFQPICSECKIDIWQTLFYSTIEIIETPGDHRSMFSEQNSLILSKIFKNKINE